MIHISFFSISEALSNKSNFYFACSSPLNCPLLLVSTRYLKAIFLFQERNKEKENKKQTFGGKKEDDKKKKLTHVEIQVFYFACNRN